MLKLFGRQIWCMTCYNRGYTKAFYWYDSSEWWKPRPCDLCDKGKVLAVKMKLDGANRC